MNCRRTVFPVCSFQRIAEGGDEWRVTRRRRSLFFYIWCAGSWLFRSPVTRHLSFFGGHKAVVRPDPIPNSAVKHSLADGSSPIGSARVGCRQSFKKAETSTVSAFLLEGLVGNWWLKIGSMHGVVRFLNAQPLHPISIITGKDQNVCNGRLR